jgi:hypothetical protein
MATQARRHAATKKKVPSDIFDLIGKGENIARRARRCRPWRIPCA